MALTVEQFAQRLTSSGVMSEELLLDALSQVTGPECADGEQLARELVKRKLLTKFQAEQIYAGKEKSLTLGNYVILDKLGQGGMGVVLKAEHKRLKRLVALKVMSPAAVKSPDALKRFHREVEAAAKLRHPNVVATDDADEAKGTHFLVMEYVDGSDLSVLVKKHGPMPVEQAVRCIIQAARGLEFAHEQGVIHRDIKPANLLIDAKGTVKILDMGLARIDGSVGGSSEGAGLTNTGTIMGTVDYMSPEQAMDTKHADARSDIYSLGCSLYYLVTGKVVYDGDTMMKKLMAHQHQSIPELVAALRSRTRESSDERDEHGSLTISATNGLDTVFRRMVAKRPEDRPQTMTQVIAELERCLSGGSATVAFQPSSNTTTTGVGNGNELQDFLRQISGEESLTATSPAPAGSKGTAVAPSSGEAETMISAAGDGGTDPRTEQTVTLNRSGEPMGVSPRTVRGLTPSGSPVGQKKKTVLLSSVAAAMVVLLGIMFAVRGKSGTQPLEINDDLIEVTIGDTGRVVKGVFEEDIRLPLGEHVLHVKRDDLAFDTEAFEVTKGENVPIKVERVGRLVRAMQGSTLLGHKESQKSNDKATVSPVVSDFALEFDRGLIEIPLASLDPNRPWTIEGDVQPADRPNPSHGLLAAFGGDSWQVSLGHESLRLLEQSAPIGQVRTESIIATTSVQLSPRRRFHVAAVFDGTRAKLFVEGKLIGSAAPKFLPKQYLGKMYFGHMFHGTMNEWRISKVARYEKGFTPPQRYAPDADTLALYHFDEGTGDVLKDSSGNNHHGKIVRAKWVRADGGSADFTSPATAPINLLSLIDPGSHAIKGKWEVLQGELLSDQTLAATIQIPYQPPAEYDLQLTFTRRAGTGVIAPVLVKGDRQFQFDYAGWSGDIFGFGKVDGRKTNDNSTTVRRPQLVNGRKYTALLQIRNDHAKAWLDGELISELKTDYSNVSPDDLVRLRDSRSLGLVTNAAWTIHSLTLEPVIGDRAAARPNQIILPPSPDEFVSLFNGKDLTGWTQAVGDAGKWRVENALLVGTSEQRFSHLFTADGDYKDFYLRMTMKLKSNAEHYDSGILLRATLDNKPEVAGDEIQIKDANDEYLTGSFQRKAQGEKPPSIPHNTWFTLEVIAQGNQISTRVNGKEILSRAEVTTERQQGHLAIQTYGYEPFQQEVSVKSIEVKRLPLNSRNANWRPLESGSAPPLAIAPFDAQQARARQEAWAKHLGVPVEYTNSIGMKFMLIPPGEFMMGSTAAEVEETLKLLAPNELLLSDGVKSEAPRHKVILTQPFYLGATEVTQAEHEKVMGKNPSWFAKTGPKSQSVKNLNTSKHPVEFISWEDAAKFCDQLSQQEKRKPFDSKLGAALVPSDATGYRLPTEAEWEFACRAGTTTKFWTGETEDELLKAGWFSKNSNWQTHAAGELLANPFGLFDIHGNVFEWVRDVSQPAYYELFQEQPAVNPTGASTAGPVVVIRGGDCSHPSYRSQSSHRSTVPPTYRDQAIGFRVSLPVAAVKQQFAHKDGTTPKPAVAPFDAQQARAHQEAWAKHLGTTVETTNSVGAKMILIPPGEFLMGSSDEQVAAALKVAEEIKADQATKDRIQKSEGPQHRVVITKPFLMGATEVTIGQFKKFAAATSYQTEAEKEELKVKTSPPPTTPGQPLPNPIQTYLNPGYPVSDDSPAAWIAWNDAVAYCRWLSAQEKKTYRLPTEAEWEYACRAGTTTQYSFGDDYNELPKYGWHNLSNAGTSHPVGMLLPNNFGLLDMHGNLYEWCDDYWDEKWYEKSSINNPIGPAAGPNRVIRGGNWFNLASRCRSAFRFSYSPSIRHSTSGFRCVRVLDALATPAAKTP